MVAALRPVWPSERATIARSFACLLKQNWTAGLGAAHSALARPSQAGEGHVVLHTVLWHVQPFCGTLAAITVRKACIVHCACVQFVLYKVCHQLCFNLVLGGP
jgi:hypothetical protein